MTDQTPPTVPAGAAKPALARSTTAQTSTALIVSLGVAVVMLVGAFVSGISYLLQQVLQSFGNAYSSGGAFDSPLTTLEWIGSSIGQNVLGALAVALGVFLSLRFFRPISAGSSLLSVILRGLIATASGAIVSTIFSVLAAGFAGASVDGSFFGNSFPGLNLFSQSLENLGWALAGLPARAASLATTILLVTVLGWLWLRRTPLR